MSATKHDAQRALGYFIQVVDSGKSFDTAAPKDREAGEIARKCSGMFRLGLFDLWTDADCSPPTLSEKGKQELTSEYREVDRDNCKTRTRRVASKEEAERLAKEVYPQTHNGFGFVEYWHARYEAYDDGDGSGPYLPHWQATEEHPETYEGEE